MDSKELSLIGTLSPDKTGIVFSNPQIVKRVLSNYVDKKLLVTFKPLEYQRSSSQNRWMWGVAYVTIVAWYKETQGESITKEDVHEYVLQHVLRHGVQEKDILGKLTIVPGQKKRTSGLTVGEFQEFKEKLQAHFAERGCDIPDPVGSNTLSEFIDE